MSKELQQLSEKPLEITEVRTVRRLTLKNFFSHIFDAYNLGRGLLFTLKELFVSPGKMAKAYIGADRFKYVPPFRLLLVSTTLAILVLKYSALGNSFLEGWNQQPSDNGNKGLQLMKSLTDYLNLFLWLFIPIAAFFQWLFNRKAIFNYTENLVYHTFIFTVSNAITLIYGLDSLVGGDLAYGAATLIFFAFYTYAYKQFFTKSWVRAFFENLIIVLLTFIIQVVGVAFLVVLYGIQSGTLNN